MSEARVKGFVDNRSSDNISLALKKVKRQNSSAYSSSNESILQSKPKPEIFESKEEEDRARLIHSAGAPIGSAREFKREPLSIRIARK